MRNSKSRRKDDNRKLPRGVRVSDLLHEGRQNAITARELAAVFDCDSRDITRAIERERQDGAPICATGAAPAGYYLPKDAAELREYCRRLKNRRQSIARTWNALCKTLERMLNGE